MKNLVYKTLHISALMLLLLVCSSCFQEDDNADNLRSLLFEPKIPSAPENLQLTQQGQDLVLQWDAVGETRYYHVYQSEPGSSGFFRHTTNYETTESRIRNVISGQTYFFYVTSITLSGTFSDPSETVEIIVN